MDGLILLLDDDGMTLKVVKTLPLYNKVSFVNIS